MEKLLEKMVSAAYPESTADKIVQSIRPQQSYHAFERRRYKIVLNSNAFITLVNKNLISKFTASLNFSLIK